MRSTILITSPDQWVVPGQELFQFGPIIPGGPEWSTEPVLVAMLSAVVAIALCWAAFAKPKIIPRGRQSIGEYAERLTVLGAGLGVIGVAMTIVMTAFEMFIMFLQAFLFAMLAAMFIASGLRGSH
ncbi:hypothetical protein [Nonomuraea aridisoli]|uniref:F0F1 ATP synthase subunit A n=1 Tax=Nonomuraea aridisoli TaxID=2070368 RepID=A0A2W2DXH0_9ACTN|nr:hypothetical protein [Nonomuraea aridisoli]PZG09785.1 hypothetical protein C1J01_37175 [Nonomuraea aridisoli]